MAVGNCMRQSGFTLIELLVALAVAVIFVTIAVPGFQHLISTNRLAAGYNEVLSGLNYARGEAVKRRKSATFDILSTNGALEYKVFMEGSSAEPMLNRRIENVSLGIDSFWVTFDSLGRRKACINTSDCQFSIENGETKTIAISLAGRIGKPLNEIP